MPEVQALLKAGAAREYRDSADYTALHAAAKLGQAEAVKALCDGGVSVNAKGDDVTALHHAAFYGHPATVQALVDAGAAVGASNSEGHTPLRVKRRREWACGGAARLLLVAEHLRERWAPMARVRLAFAANKDLGANARVLLKATAASGVLPADSKNLTAQDTYTNPSAPYEMLGLRASECSLLYFDYNSERGREGESAQRGQVRYQ